MRMKNEALGIKSVGKQGDCIALGRMGVSRSDACQSFSLTFKGGI